MVCSFVFAHLRPQLGYDYVSVGDRIFFLDYITLEWRCPNDSPPPRERTFKKIPSWDSAPDIQNKTWVKLPNSRTVFYKEVHPFFLSLDECGTWLKWDFFPNIEGRIIKALTPRVKPCNPRGQQPRGIAQFMDCASLDDLLAEYSFKFANLPGDNVPMSDFKECLLSLLTHSTPKNEDPGLPLSTLSISD